MRKVFLVCFVFFVFLTVTAQPSEAWRATVAEQIVQTRQMLEQIAQKRRMLENLTGALRNGLEIPASEIMAQFDQVHDLWRQATSLSHSMDDFIPRHNERHAEHRQGEVRNAEAERLRQDREFREMVAAYLEGLNINAQNFENREQARQRMFDTLTRTEGQVQAIQALGALMNHTSTMIDQQTEVLSSFITMQMEAELERRNQERTANKNMELALEYGMNIQPPSRRHTPSVIW